MVRFAFIVATLLTLLLSGYKGADVNNEQYLIFLASIDNQSTFNYFTVIKVKDLNTGLTKDICSSGNFVSGALHTELNADHDKKGELKVSNFAKSKTDRYFEFKNKKSLDNISFKSYDNNQLVSIQKKYNFDEIIKVIKRDKKYSVRLSDSEILTFAHILFNRGIMSGESSCFGGTLEYVDRTKKPSR